MSEATYNECLQGAWQALLRGDTAERDRLCERAEVLFEAENYASAVERVLAADFYVRTDGVAIPTKRLAEAAKALQ